MPAQYAKQMIFCTMMRVLVFVCGLLLPLVVAKKKGGKMGVMMKHMDGRMGKTNNMRMMMMMSKHHKNQKRAVEYSGSVNPFTLGVASGEPTAHSVILWTRLAPDPVNTTNPGGMPDGEAHVYVYYEVCADEACHKDIDSGYVVASADTAHAVHVTLDHLDPDTYYFYRFSAGDFTSTVGRTKTLPYHHLRQVKFAHVSCNEYEFGYWTAFEHLAEEDIDFWIHLGDYIYETGAINPFLSPVRAHEPSIEVTTISEYRVRWALYKLDPHLQKLHAMHPVFYVYDDHEIDNDWAGDVPEDSQSTDAFVRRRTTGNRVIYEHLPVPEPPNGPSFNLYVVFRWVT